MAVTNRLVYDATDANSIAASSTIGGYVLSGDDGTPIGHVSDALKVDIGSVSDLDIRALTQSDEITVYQGTSPWVIGDGGGSITIDATQLDIDDLNAANDSVAAWLSDGSGNAIGSTGGSLDVNVTNSIDVDDGLANTAIENTATPVSTTAVAVVSSALANRKYIALANEGNKALFVGKSGVTTANGFPLYPGAQQVWRIGPTPVMQVIGGNGASGEDLRVMELS